MNKIISDEIYNFIESEMCINPHKYLEKILQFSTNTQKIFSKLIIYLFTEDENKEEFSINDTYRLGGYKILIDANITNDKSNDGYEIAKSAYEVADIIIRAFSRYKKFGLLNLYRMAESDLWDPLPEISKSLYNQMPDFSQKIFDNLSDKVTLYRGTSLLEYENGSFSQSWTLDRNKAIYFAYELGKYKYEGTKRAVIKASIFKENIYAYISQEEECIINPDKILRESIELISTRVFTKID